MEYLIKKYDTKKEMIAIVNKKNVSRMLGNKKSNVKEIKDKYDVLLKTKEKDLDINEIEFLIDNEKCINVNIKDIYEELKNIYSL